MLLFDGFMTNIYNYSENKATFVNYIKKENRSAQSLGSKFNVFIFKEKGNNTAVFSLPIVLPCNPLRKKAGPAKSFQLRRSCFFQIISHL